MTRVGPPDFDPSLDWKKEDLDDLVNILQQRRQELKLRGLQSSGEQSRDMLILLEISSNLVHTGAAPCNSTPPFNRPQTTTNC
jgi:hypothetical protein